VCVCVCVCVCVRALVLHTRAAGAWQKGKTKFILRTRSGTLELAGFPSVHARVPANTHLFTSLSEFKPSGSFSPPNVPLMIESDDVRSGDPNAIVIHSPLITRSIYRSTDLSTTR